MLNKIIKFSLNNRIVVLIGALLLIIAGTYTAVNMEVDVFPDLNARWLAAKENVPLIDLNEMTRTLYEALGTETSKRAFVHYPAGTYPGQTKAFEDNTHFNPYGAYQIAQCVIEGMKKAVPELAKHLKIDPSYNPAQPDDVNGFHWNESPFTEIEKPDGN